MPLSPCILTCAATLGVVRPLEEVLCTASPANRSWTQRAALKPNLSAHLTTYLTPCGPSVSWNTREFLSRTFPCVKTTKVHVSLRLTVEPLPVRSPATSSSGIFGVKDVIDRERINLEHCSTESMLADFFTKPLQGNLFQRLRDIVMGHEHTDTLMALAPSQERVEKPTILEGLEGYGPNGHICNKVANRQNNVQWPSYADVVTSQNSLKNSAASTKPDEDTKEHVLPIKR